MQRFNFKSGPVMIKATAAGRAPTVNVIAYNGGPMWVEGAGCIVVDLGGLEIPNPVPLLVDHDLSVEGTIGAGIAQVDNGERIVISGSLTTVSAKAQHVIALSKVASLQASVGLLYGDGSTAKISAGKTIEVNGRTITADGEGFTLILQSKLIETSIVTKGADGTTSVSIAARRARASNMSFEEWVKQTYDMDAGQLSEALKNLLMEEYDREQSGGDSGDAGEGGTATATALKSGRRIAASDYRRIEQIQRIAGKNPRVAAAAIENGWSAKDTELHMLRAERKPAPSGHRRSDGEGFDSNQVIEASFLLGQGVSEKFMGKHYDQQILNMAMARENRGISLHGVINSVLRASGRSTGWQRVNNQTIGEAFEGSRMLQASGFSGGSLPGLLGNIAGKILLDAYQQIATTWQLFTGIQSSQNFKSFYSYQLTVKGELTEMARGGTFDHLNLAESEYANKIGTRGAILSLTREDMIDDDVNAFAAIPQALGRLGAISLEKAIYKTFLANLAALFTTGNKNYFEGILTNLSITSLGTAEQLFLQQVDPNGDPMLLVPKLLGVSPKNSAASSVVCRDTAVQHPADIDTPESTGNPHGGKFSPFVSPWINNANLAGSDDDHWFLLAQPVGNQGIVNVAFLNGQQSPTVEQGDVDFSQLGVAWRIYFDFGVAAGDYRFGVRSKGKA